MLSAKPLLAKLGLVILLLITAWSYQQVLDNKFVWDDEVFLNQRSDYRQSDAIEMAFKKPFFISTDYYRPLAVISYVLQVSQTGVDPKPFHAANLILHLCNVMLVYLAALFTLKRNQLVKNESVIALFIATFYGLHPALIEATSWVSGRFDLLVTFFLLLTLLFDQIFQRRKLVQFALVFISYLCAAFSKEAALSFIASLLIWHQLLASLRNDEFSLRVSFEAFKSGLPSYVAIVAGAVIYSVTRIHFLGYFTSQGVYSDYGSFIQHLLLISKAAWFYAMAALFPLFKIAPFHYQEMPISLDDKVAWLSVALSALFLILFAVLKGRFFKWAGILLVFWACLTPVLFLVQFPQPYNIGQERYLQFPLYFIAFFLIYAVGKAVERSGNDRVGIVATVVLVLWSGLSILNIQVTAPLWKDNLTLWSWATTSVPECAICWSNLGEQYMLEGDQRTAEKLVNEALALKSKYKFVNASAYAVLGNIQMRKGLRKEAAESYLKSLELNLARTEVQANMAKALIFMREFDSAELYLGMAIKSEPNNYSILLNYGLLRLSQGRIEEAQKYFTASIENCNPRDKQLLKQYVAGLLDGSNPITYGDTGKVTL